jgi:parvulin-like peptidyl-prolyl isomerase
MMIEEALCRQFLQKLCPVTDAEVQQAVRDLIEEYKKKPPEGCGPGQTLAELTVEAADQLRWQKYLELQIPQPVARSYYIANKPHFDKIQVRASHILVAVKSDASEEERQHAKVKVERLYKKILSGKIDFADAAKRFSDCEASKAGGGDIGWFRYKFVVVDEIATVAFSMKVGDISPPVETQFGHHILKLTERTAGEPSSFEKMIHIVREVYAQDHEFYQRIVRGQRKISTIEVFSR